MERRGKNSVGVGVALVIAALFCVPVLSVVVADDALDVEDQDAALLEGLDEEQILRMLELLALLDMGSEGAAELPDDFTKLLHSAHGHLDSRGHYVARGTLYTRMKHGRRDHEAHYGFTLAKQGPGNLSISVYSAEDAELAARLLAAGNGGADRLYLPRAINPMTVMARIHEQPQGMVVPVMLMLYDFLEKSGPTGWLYMLRDGRMLLDAEGVAEGAACLEMTFSRYFTFRDLYVRMSVHDPAGDAPTIAGLHIDLRTMFREIPGVGAGADDEEMDVAVTLTLDDWSIDAPPSADVFAEPAPRVQYRGVEVDNMFFAADSRLQARRGAGAPAPHSDESAGTVSIDEISGGRISASLMAELQQLPRTPATARMLMNEFRSLPRSEQRRIVNELRSSPMASQLKSRARQMGLTDRDIQHFESLLGF